MGLNNRHPGKAGVGRIRSVVHLLGVGRLRRRISVTRDGRRQHDGRDFCAHRRQNSETCGAKSSSAERRNRRSGRHSDRPVVCLSLMSPKTERSNMMRPHRDGPQWVGLLILSIASICGCDGSLRRPVQTNAPDSSQLPQAADGSPDAASACLIAGSNYDQSCSTDSDCVRVDFGNYCKWLCRCGGDAINRGSFSQFTADIAMTPLGQGRVPGVCSCGYIFGPCCRNAQCTTGTACGTDAGS